MLGVAGVLVAAAAMAVQPPVAKPVDPPGTVRPGQPTTKPSDPAGTADGTKGQPVAKPADPSGNAAKPAQTTGGTTGGAPTGGTAPSPPAAGPTTEQLGLPIYPDAKFITSYEAGLGQRFYLFGSAAAFADVVSFYKLQLKLRGELIFDMPATHTFEVGRYKESEVAFPPGVTVKDYTWNGSNGLLNPVPGAQPARFPTVIQLVPGPGGLPVKR